MSITDTEPASEPDAAPEPAPVAEPQAPAEHEPALDEAAPDHATVKAAGAAAMADAWTAEAMAKPLPDEAERLSLHAAFRLAERGSYVNSLVLAHVWLDQGDEHWGYLGCKPVTEAECLLFAERIEREARDAVNAGLKEWRAAGRPETEFADYRLKNEHLQPPAAPAEAAAA